ncbi:MAG: 2-hydroxyacid dehydrogenase [Caulobacter sp.]|nr:2-hydroxyacid dehydrogenase [Caulobacter sp.]
MVDPRPDLLLVPGAPATLEAPLAERFVLHRRPEAAADAIRAIAGGGSSVVDAALIAGLPALEIIAIHGVGHEGIDLAAARARNIRVTLTPDVLTDDVADLAIALWLSVHRRLVVNDRALRAGGWNAPLARRASGRRIGLFGMGHIGQAIARRAQPFAAEILYTSRAAKPDLPWRFLPDLRALAQASDVLIVAVAGGAATRHAVDAAVLDALGPEGVLINIARGPIVDEAALIAALERGGLAGAGLDVFEDEPRVPKALLAMDQVVLSPHQGSATREGRAQMAALVLANLDAHFRGEAPPSAIV